MSDEYSCPRQLSSCSTSAEAFVQMNQRRDRSLERVRRDGRRLQTCGRPAVTATSLVSHFVATSTNALAVSRMPIDLDRPPQIGDGEVESDAPVPGEVDRILTHQPGDARCPHRVADQDLRVRFGRSAVGSSRQDP